MPHDAAQACQPRQPYNSQVFEVLKVDLIHSQRFVSDGGWWRCINGIEELFEVFLPPSNNIPSWGQKVPTPTGDIVGRALLPPPKVPDVWPIFSMLPDSYSPLLHQTPDSSFHLQDSAQCPQPGVHYRVMGFLPQMAPETVRLQLKAAILTMEAENMLNSDSCS